MNTLVQRGGRRPALWDAFGDFDGLFGDFLRPRTAVGDAPGALVPAVDVAETEHEYRIKAELPGVKKEDLDVTVQDGILTINAETRYEDEEKKDGRVIRQERRYGKFVRSMRLGKDVDASKVKAEYKDGVLKLKLPKHDEVKPKKIAVDIH